MENRAAARRSPDKVEVGRSNLSQIVETGRGLIASERQRRATPGINAEDRFAAPRRARLQDGVASHVLGARARRSEEKTPAAVTSLGVHTMLNCHSYEHH